jgi:hypothetical protein
MFAGSCDGRANTGSRVSSCAVDKQLGAPGRTFAKLSFRIDGMLNTIAPTRRLLRPCISPRSFNATLPPWPSPISSTREPCMLNTFSRVCCATFVVLELRQPWATCGLL